MSGYSGIDPATTILFTDDPIVAGVTARAVHIAELRQGVNAMRASIGLAAATFTDSIASGSTIKAVHLNELRAALSAARTAMALSTAYTDDPITASVTVLKAV